LLTKKKVCLRRDDWSHFSHVHFLGRSVGLNSFCLAIVVTRLCGDMWSGAGPRYRQNCFCLMSVSGPAASLWVTLERGQPTRPLRSVSRHSAAQPQVRGWDGEAWGRVSFSQNSCRAWSSTPVCSFSSSRNPTEGDLGAVCVAKQ